MRTGGSRGIAVVQYSDEALSAAAELGRDVFPDLDARDDNDRCVIASFAIAQLIYANGLEARGEPWSTEDGGHGVCLELTGPLTTDARGALSTLVHYGFSIQCTALTDSSLSWWSGDSAGLHEGGHVEDLEHWLQSLDTPTVQEGLRALLEDMHPSDIEERDSRNVYTRLGLAYLAEHANHDPAHDVYRDLALMAATEITFPASLPITCFTHGLDPVIREDVYI